ncbi:MAG: hypothetical protein ACLUOI_33435 [Eisenbergiella sp.]
MWNVQDRSASSETVERLRADQAKISCVSITLRSSDFENRNRQMQLSSATDVTEEIYVSTRLLMNCGWKAAPPDRCFHFESHL